MSKQPKKVLFVPNYSDGNPYQYLLAKSLKPECEVTFENFPDGLDPFTQLYKLHPDMKVLHLHWITSVIERLCWSRHFPMFYSKLMLILWDLLRLKSKGVWIVWTIHNRRAHQGFNFKRECIVRRWFAKVVDETIVHSQNAAKSLNALYGKAFSARTAVIPHGNYEGCYPSPSKEHQVIRSEKKIASSTKILLFFGNILPYKGLDLLLDAMDRTTSTVDLHLIIIGDAHDQDYKQLLQRKIDKLENVTVEFGYVEDQVLINYINACDAVIVPFANTLTSGSVILTMTMGKALVLPKRSKILGCVPDQGVTYFSDLQKLIEVLNELPTLDLNKMGSINLAASKLLDWKKIGEKTKCLYNLG